MELLLERKIFNDKSTVGDLSIDGKFFCFTLEDKVREPGVKVPGETAIPAGLYEIKMTWSPKYKKIMPLICDVPMFDGVRIHSGNIAEHSEGCVLVGYVNKMTSIEQSKSAFLDLYDILVDACEKGAVWIRIVNKR